MKSNLEYYPHQKDSHSHPKFKLLRAIYGGGDKGWAAEGRFWALNNIISSKTCCELDLTKKRDKADAAEVLGLSLDEFNHFIETLVSEDIELIQEVEPGIFTTEKVKEAFKLVSDERERARVRKERSRNRNNSGEQIESSGELYKRVKESKVNESRGEENNLIPSLPDVISFFLYQKRTEKEAHTFFNYFQSKGWEGIKNWEPKALIWISKERPNPVTGKNGKGNNTSGFDYFIGKAFDEMITKIEGEKCSKEIRSKYYEEYDAYYIEGIEKACWIKKEIAESQGMILYKNRNRISEEAVQELPLL